MFANVLVFERIKIAYYKQVSQGESMKDSSDEGSQDWHEKYSILSKIVETDPLLAGLRRHSMYDYILPLSVQTYIIHIHL